jgi:hypothetical protein
MFTHACVPRTPACTYAYIAQDFDEYRALEVRQAELEELIEHGEGDVQALQDELDHINDEMERLEEEHDREEESSD